MSVQKKRKPLILDILGYKYTIVEDAEITKRGRDGECDTGAEIIYVNPELSKRAFADTLFHEVLHAVMAMGMPNKYRMTELQINYLGCMVTEVLRRNPGLIKVLMA